MKRLTSLKTIDDQVYGNSSNLPNRYHFNIMTHKKSNEISNGKETIDFVEKDQDGQNKGYKLSFQKHSLNNLYNTIDNR